MRATRDYFDLAPVCNNQGWVCLKQGDNLGALRYFREGLDAAEKSGDPDRIAFMNRSLGSFYNAQKEFDKAILHLQRALDVFITLRDSAQMSDCLMSIGNAYNGMGRHETAISYYKNAMPITRAEGNTLEEGLLFENWGIALTRAERFAEAFSKLETARRLFEKINEQVELAYLYGAIGTMHLAKGDTAQAIYSLEKARQLGEALQLVDVLTENLPVLHRSYFAAGSPVKAYQTLLAYQTLRDTTAAEARQHELQRLQTEFETERKEKDIQIKTLENARLESRFGLALAGFIAAFIAGLAAWFRARQRRMANAALEAKNQEVLAQKAEAERLRERAEQSEAVKEKFLAAMSHEIRTPMNAIVGLSQLLDAERLEPAVARNVSIIRQSGEHLMAILNDVLDLAKIEAGKIELRPRVMALLPQLALVRGTFAARAREKGIDLRLETAGNLPEHIIADPVRLGQVLNNLVSNAIKFCPAGEVVLSARLENAASDSPATPGVRIAFSVRDTGIGIAPEKQAAVFEEFTQADTDVGGTGLGLSIARRLVAQMGGELQLRSTPGQGSVFFFTLEVPVATPAPGAEPAGGPTLIPRLLCKSPVRILLVEDNAFNQVVATQTVAAICPDITIEIAGSGASALERISTGDFDLVLTDLHMPGLDGYETARRLRDLGFNSPIVALTASAMNAEAEKCREAGMDEMLLKPIAPAQMAAMLLRYVPEKLAGAKNGTTFDRKYENAQEAPVPPALLHYAGGNPETARQLLILIRTELNECLSVLPALQAASDAAGIRRRVHKLRPQLIALGTTKHQALLDALEHPADAGAGFWAKTRKLATVLEKTLTTLS